jgi:hypothetical protein
MVTQTLYRMDVTVVQDTTLSSRITVTHSHDSETTRSEAAVDATLDEIHSDLTRLFSPDAFLEHLIGVIERTSSQSSDNELFDPITHHDEPPPATE